LPKEIYESDPISIPEVRELLLARAKEGDELSYMQRIALEHAHLTSRVTSEVAENLVRELMEKFRITKKGAITLANFIPDTTDEIKLLLGKEAGSFEQETFLEIKDTLVKVELLDESQRMMDLDSIEDSEFEEKEDKEIDESMIPEDLR
jgi:DNA-directed RNA polymerase subunit F